MLKQSPFALHGAQLVVVFNEGTDMVGSSSDADAESVVLENPDENSKEQESRMLKTVSAICLRLSKPSYDT